MTAHDLKIVQEHEDAMQRAVDEANDYIVSAEDSAVIGAVADLIAEHPHLFAIRFLRMERQVEELRQQFDASTLGAYAGVKP